MLGPLVELSWCSAWRNSGGVDSSDAWCTSATPGGPLSGGPLLWIAGADSWRTPGGPLHSGGPTLLDLWQPSGGPLVDLWWTPDPWWTPGGKTLVDLW